MTEHAQLDIPALVEEINAAEDDPMWKAWTKDRLRLQDQLHELRAVRDALARKLRALAPTTPGGDKRPMTRREQRMAMGGGGLWPLAQAAEMLPMKDNEARGWLRNEGLVGDLAGREVVHWGRVLDAPYATKDEAPSVPAKQETRRRKPLPRVRLGGSSGASR
ncbi:MAG: hypothetical protein KC549_12510 [Myxococcales bacterium]|nr:hypothetical protein [Myxococcales bacterium]MCB9544696.1 hypothetical protein [Myxococcales bacterium]